MVRFAPSAVTFASPAWDTSSWVGAEYTPWRAGNELWWHEYESFKPDLDRQLEESVLALLAARAPSSICPSEAAKRVAPDDWRSLMERTRQAARRLAHLGEVVITQGGRPVDPTAFKGPIRVQLHKRTADRPSNQQRGV